MLTVFESISLDGYFRAPDGDVSWSHSAEEDPEFDALIAGNATGGGTLLFGRVTYEMMQSFWPSPSAAQQFPVVAREMNRLPKLVISRTLKQVTWQNTTLLTGELVAEVKKRKREDVTILGSGSLVPPLAKAGLIDEYQFVVVPVTLGAGATLFGGVEQKLRLVRSRSFKNGNVLLVYRP